MAFYFGKGARNKSIGGLLLCVKACKHAHNNWKDNRTLENTAKRKAAKKGLRSAQRKLACRERNDEQRKIMEAEGRQDFDKLVRKQRNAPKACSM